VSNLVYTGLEASEDDLGVISVLGLHSIMIVLTVARTMTQSSQPTDLTMKLLTYRRRKTVSQHMTRKTVETAIIGTVQ